MIKVGKVIDDALFIPSKADLLMYVRLQGESAPRSGDALTKLWSAAHIWRKKSHFKFGIYLFLCRNFIIFVLKLVYLYIKLRSVTSVNL